MHAGLSVLRRPAGSRLRSSTLVVYFAEVFGSRHRPMGCPSCGGQRAVGPTGWEETWKHFQRQAPASLKPSAFRLRAEIRRPAKCMA